MDRIEGNDDMRPFRLLNSAKPSHGPRLGELTLPQRHAIETPHYIAVTSRGAVPHLTQDNLKQHSNIKAAYLGLEDFIENAPRRTPPIFQQSVNGGVPSLRTFISFPQDTALFLGPRRIPSVNTPHPSPKSEPAPNRSMTISTSAGFQVLDVDEYIDDIQKLKPGFVIGMSDNVVRDAPGRRRMGMMVDRTAAWTRKLLQSIATPASEKSSASPHVLAPILPLSAEVQSQYFAQLEDEVRNKLCGLALHDTACLEDLPDGLRSILCLSMDSPSTPQKVLDEVARGIDLFVLPFVVVGTDAGLAFDFEFPVSNALGSSPQGQQSQRRPLAIDMWARSHTIDLSPLREGCSCYVCKTHHRAYVYHLLNAKEMLAWVLLQIHNHHIIEAFFAGVRESILKGSFETDAEIFSKAYEPKFPEKTGQGPRLRGYQIKSEGPGESKKNPTAYNSLDRVREKIAEAPLEPGPDVVAIQLENQGLGTTTGSEASMGKPTNK